jgi:hypothetical protein
MCGRAIQPGERYHRQRSIQDDGKPYAHKTCAHCQALALLLDLYAWADDGVTFDDFALYEPASVMEARWLVQWRRHWRRRDGVLYPVPEQGTGGE